MILLASSSPRRRALLREAGLRCRIVRPDYHEKPIPGASARTLVRAHAWGKALSAVSLAGRGIVLGADTVVRFRGRTIGKPKNLKDAVRILRALQGRWHEVYTGVALLAVDAGRPVAREVFVEKTRVRLRPMGDAEIARYFRRVNPLDKAGAYAIQSKIRIVEEVSGSFSNAVGLPLESVLPRIRKLNLLINK